MKPHEGPSIHLPAVNSINTIVSSLLGYAFLHVTGTSLAGWRIMFLAVAGVSTPSCR
jgi:hypothetical protein